MTELKPCPFCGGKVDIQEGCYDYDGGNRYLYYSANVVCYKCDLTMHVSNNNHEHMPYEHALDFAIAAWNSRAAIEYDNWFYLPKPKEPIAEIVKSTDTWNGLKVKTEVFYQVQEQAIVNWARELDEYIIKRICDVWGMAGDDAE